MVEKQDNLALIATFYKVVGAIALVFSLLPVIHLVLGVAMVAEFWNEGPLAFFGALFIMIPLIFIAVGVAFSISMFIVSGYLKEKIHYRRCQVICGISCMFMPFGTVLGILGLLELAKDETRESFFS